MRHCMQQADTRHICWAAVPVPALLPAAQIAPSQYQRARCPLQRVPERLPSQLRTRASTGSLFSSFSSRRRLEPLVDTENCRVRMVLGGMTLSDYGQPCRVQPPQQPT